MKLYTIGFTQKTAEQFFALLKDAKVKTLWDIRLKNHSQLAAFAKYPDIAFFLDQLLDIRYAHFLDLATSPELMHSWRHDEIDWKTFQKIFMELMDSRDVKKLIKKEWPLAEKPICLLCSEDKPEFCHRTMVAQIITELYPKVDIVHL